MVTTRRITNMRLNVLRSDARDIMEEITRISNIVRHKSIPGDYYEEHIQKDIAECHKLIHKYSQKYYDIMNIIYSIEKEYKCNLFKA